MSEDFLVPDGDSRIEIIIKKSRFIAEAVAVSSVEDARLKIKMKKEEYPQSNHVVYAFIIGDRSSEVSGMSDDGEPSGTAGKPVMDILKGSGIFNVLVTVVRFFGGIKLGTGGLVRAYSESAKKAVEELSVIKFVRKIHFSLEVPYDYHEKVELIVTGAGGTIEKKNFTNIVIITGALPEANLESCNAELKNISGGKIFI
jgi:uncharacterized YigZ family protein